MLLCNSIHFRLKTLFGTSGTDMPLAKNYTLTNSAAIFATTKILIIFVGVYPKTHTLPLTALTDDSFVVFFLSKPSRL